jgi:thioester reductase-like protein
MAYFVTGGTGFIGRFLVENLLKRGDPIYVLVRKESQKKLDALREIWKADEKQVVSAMPTRKSSKARSSTCFIWRRFMT